MSSELLRPGDRVRITGGDNRGQRGEVRSLSTRGQFASVRRPKTRYDITVHLNYLQKIREKETP